MRPPVVPPVPMPAGPLGGPLPCHGRTILGGSTSPAAEPAAVEPLPDDVRDDGAAADADEEIA